MSERAPLIRPTSADGNALLELLHTAYGVPRNSRKIILTITAGGPIEILVDYLPEDSYADREVKRISAASKKKP